MFNVELLVCVCTLFYHGVQGDSITVGDDPNVTGLLPPVSTSRKTILESADINLMLKVYESPANATIKRTIKAVSGSTNISSANRCIAWGISFNLWTDLPIVNHQTIENGGCDALWENECSRGILARLQQSLGNNISATACGVPMPDLDRNPPPGCPRKNTTRFSMSTSTILNNGSFFLDNAAPTDPARTWIYLQTDSGSDSDYNELMKYNVFTYFVSRSYDTANVNTVRSAIACMTVYNTSSAITTTKPTDNGQPMMRPGSLLMIVMMTFITKVFC